MDSINKEHIIAGVIGGITALTLGFLAKKAMWKLRKGGRGGRWPRQEAKIETMVSDKLPAAIGPYTIGKMVMNPNGSSYAWSSGQLGLCKDGQFAVPKEGEEPVQAQARQVLENLKNLAKDNGFELEKHTVKNVVYLVDMKDFAKVNEIYKEYFPSDYPARTCIAIKELPRGGLVEIESVFYKPPAPRKQCCPTQQSADPEKKDQ